MLLVTTLRIPLIAHLQCDGTRPRCNRCRDNGQKCEYDVAEGVSRVDRIKIRRMDSRTSELEDLKRIVTSLRSGTDDHAAAILARLRLGEPPEDIAKTLLMTAPLEAAGKNSRYALLICYMCLLQYVNNPATAYWARSLPTPLRAGRLTGRPLV